MALVEMDAKEDAESKTTTSSTESTASTSTSVPSEHLVSSTNSAVSDRRKFSLPGGKEESYNGHLLATCVREACEEAGVKGRLIMFLGTFVDPSIASAVQRRDGKTMQQQLVVKKTNWSACFVFKMTEVFTPTEKSARGVIWAPFTEAMKIIERSKPSQTRILYRFKRKYIDQRVISLIESREQCGRLLFGRVELIEKFVKDEELSTKEVPRELMMTVNSVPTTFRTFRRDQLRTPPRFELDTSVVTPGSRYALLIVATHGTIDDESTRFSSLRYFLGNCSGARPIAAETTAQGAYGYSYENVTKQKQQFMSELLSSGREFVQYEGPIASCETQSFVAFLVKQSMTVSEEYLQQFNSDPVYDRDLQFAKQEHLVDEETGGDSNLRRRNWDVSSFINKSCTIEAATYFVVSSK